MVVVRVLIVDDQVSFRQAARNVVELTDGFEVAGEVSSGEDSVEAARSLRPDLVLMDVRLPGIDGLEASRRIRRTDARGRGPVILLVSTEEPADAAEWVVDCGAAAYVPKSEFGSERLVAAWASATRSS
jgi:DNA-binding NarL/FixJ family response regulator